MSNKYVTLKTFYITVIFLCCFILLCLLTAVHLISLKEKELLDSLVMPVRTIQNNHADTPVKEEVQISDILYIVAEHNGRIGIFNPERTTVFEVLDVYVDYLPDTDRQYLKSGINIYSNDELLSVISDYTG